MSASKIETFSISHNLRPAPYYEDTGIPIAPRKRSCVGESCPYVATPKGCYKDVHHLLFTSQYYAKIGGIYQRLQQDPFMRVRLARCRHNGQYPRAQHSLYDFSPLPSAEATYGFLDESRLLRCLSSATSVVSEKINSYLSTSPKERYHANRPNVVAVRAEKIARFREVSAHCIRQVHSLEVVPSRIFAGVLERVNHERTLQAQRVLEPYVPELIRQAFYINETTSAS